MNKRKRKKINKKEDLFISSFVKTYKELREENRFLHEHFIKERRRDGKKIN